MRQVLKLFVLNATIAATVVVCYSPYLLGLRPTDQSIFRAGSSVLVALFCLIAFFAGNLKLLSTKEYVMEDGRLSRDDITSVFKKFSSNKVVGSYIKTALEQNHRFMVLTQAIDSLVDDKFEKESISWYRYHSVVTSAKEHVLNCYNDLATAVISFDYLTWSKRRTYIFDDIRDDLQKEQFELLQKELDNMNQILADVEAVILNLNKMKAELRTSTSEETSDTLGTIEKLVSELQYYK